MSEFLNRNQIKQNFYNHITNLKSEAVKVQKYELAATLWDAVKMLRGNYLDKYFIAIEKEILPIYRQNQISSILEDGDYIKPLEVFETKAYQDLLEKCNLTI